MGMALFAAAGNSSLRFFSRLTSLSSITTLPARRDAAIFSLGEER